MGRDQDNERIVLDTKFGKLVCEVVRDDEDYKEFAIDLYRNDGKAVQVCVVGTDEHEWERTDWFDDETNRKFEEQNGKVHIYMSDGESQDCEGSWYVEPYGEGWWGEETI